MITARLVDGGTRCRVDRIVPGADRIAYLQANFEEAAFEDRRSATNELMRASAERVSIAPWPYQLPAGAPVDYTERYAGITYRLAQHNQAQGADVADAWANVPGAEAFLRATPDPVPTIRELTGMVREQTLAEIWEAVQTPSDWLRLPPANTLGQMPLGGTDLLDPAILRFDALQNCRYTLKLDDNDIFTPFDLTHPEWYEFFDDNGAHVDNGLLYSRFGDRTQLTFYLRPRRWWWFYKIIVHYEYISWFEDFPNDETFLKVYYDRAPFAPTRFDPANVGQEAMPDIWDDIWVSYDPGVDAAWQSSAACADLRREIMAQQYYTMCIVYVYTGSDPACMTIERMPPRERELVVGIGQRVGDVEQRVWAMQVEDLSAVYPRQLIDQFWCNFEAW